MKTYILIVALVIASITTFSQETPDDKKQRLIRVQNKIKSATTSKVDHYMMYGKRQNKPPVKLSLNKYDKNGFLIEETAFNERGSVESKVGYKLDSKGNTTLFIAYNSDGSIYYKTIFKPIYDNAGKLIESDALRESDSTFLGKIIYEYNDKGYLLTLISYEGKFQKSRETYEYDEKGRTTKRTLYNGANDFQGYDQMIYNEAGKHTETKSYDLNSLPYYNDVFKYDSKGNPIESIRYDVKNQPITTFKITYTLY